MALCQSRGMHGGCVPECRACRCTKVTAHPVPAEGIPGCSTGLWDQRCKQPRGIWADGRVRAVVSVCPTAAGGNPTDIITQTALRGGTAGLSKVKVCKKRCVLVPVERLECVSVAGLQVVG